MIKAVIFDYDDTLVKSSKALYDADTKTAAALGLEKPSKQDYFALWGKPHVEMIRLLHPSVDTSTYLDKYREIYNKSSL